MPRRLSLFPWRSNTAKLAESASAATNFDKNRDFDVPQAPIANTIQAIANLHSERSPLVWPENLDQTGEVIGYEHTITR